MEFWQSSSTWVKVAIAALILIGVGAIIAIIMNLGGGNEPAAPAPVPTATVDSGSDGGNDVTTPPTGPTPVVPTPDPGTPTLTTTAAVNVRSGPGTGYPIIGLLAEGQTAQVLGVSEDGGWWVIRIANVAGEQGWVTAEFATTSGTDNVPVVVAPILPIPTTGPPQPITNWQGEYFDNPNLRGDPVLVRDDEAVAFNWGNGSPAPEVPADNFSARWTIAREVPGGTYRFSVWVDDGVRIWVDNTLVLDEWQSGTARNFVRDVTVAEGEHTVRIEYFDSGGGALIQVDIGYVDFPDWKGEYFNNRDLSGDPSFVRNDASIDFFWGNQAPAPGINANNFSVRWSRSADFTDHAYTFNVEVEGGVRLWLDGILLIDSWGDQGPRQLTADSPVLTAGPHDLRVDYFKARGNGRIRVNWHRMDTTPQPPQAVISGPSRGLVGEPLPLSADGSTVAEGSHITSIRWEFGDGTVGSGSSVSHVYYDPGIFNVTLTLVDDKGQSDSATKQVQISPAAVDPDPEPPTAVIDAPAEGQVNQNVTFNAARSQATNPIVSYAWQFGDGTSADAVEINKSFSAAGIYNVTLTVTDDQGLQSTAQHQITITDTAAPTEEAPTEPTLEPTVEPTEEAPVEPTAAPTEEPGTPETPLPISAVITASVEGIPLPVVDVGGAAGVQVQVGVPVLLDGSLSTGDIVSYQWDFGDGTTPAPTAQVEHLYGAPGTYTLVLTVTDSGGSSQSTTWAVEVTE